MLQDVYCWFGQVASSVSLVGTSGAQSRNCSTDQFCSFCHAHKSARVERQTERMKSVLQDSPEQFGDTSLCNLQARDAL